MKPLSFLFGFLFLSSLAFAFSANSSDYIGDLLGTYLSSRQNASSANYQADVIVDLFSPNSSNSSNYSMLIGFYGAAGRPPYSTNATVTPYGLTCCDGTFSVRALDDNGVISAILTLNGTNYTGTLYTGTAQDGVWRYVFADELYLFNYTYWWTFTNRDNLVNETNETAYVYVANNPSRIYLTGINGVASTNIVELRWTTNRSATTLLEWGTTSALGTNVSDSAFNASHYVLLSGLSPGTTYYYRLWGCDARNNCNFTSTFTFTTVNPGGGGPGVFGPEQGNVPSGGSGGFSGGGGGGSGGSGGSGTTTTNPQVRTVLDATGPNPSSVTATFGPSSTTFAVSLSGGSAGFFGSVSERFPLDFADYRAGLIKITPTPSSVTEGSVLASWDDVSIKPGETFVSTVVVSKKYDASILNKFEKPLLVAGVAPTVVPTVEPDLSPTPEVIEEVATPTPEVGTPTPVVRKAEGISPLVYVVVLVVLAAGYFFFTQKKKPLGLKR